MDVSRIDLKGPGLCKQLDPQVSVPHHPRHICCRLICFTSAFTHTSSPRSRNGEKDSVQRPMLAKFQKFGTNRSNVIRR